MKPKKRILNKGNNFFNLTKNLLWRSRVRNKKQGRVVRTDEKAWHDYKVKRGLDNKVVRELIPKNRQLQNLVLKLMDLKSYDGLNAHKLIKPLLKTNSREKLLLETKTALVRLERFKLQEKSLSRKLNKGNEFEKWNAKNTRDYIGNEYFSFFASLQVILEGLEKSK